MPSQNDLTPGQERTLALEKWSRLTNHLQEWFFEPDLDALEIALSTALTHYARQERPVWLMVLGPPGTGKTGIVMTCLEALPYTYSQDDLSVNTFLSGFSIRKANEHSLLYNIGEKEDRQGILLFPDFTCFLAKRPEERAAILGQLRRIYDGHFDRTVGTGRLTWEGKVTVVAAATPEIERFWIAHRNLGERFVQIRWPRGNGLEQGRAATGQIEHEDFINDEMKRLTLDFVYPDARKPRLTPVYKNIESAGVMHMAEITARLRAHVPRERDGRREIIEQPEAEAPTRIIKAMSQVARAHATLFRKQEVELVDFKSSKRIALDSIPPIRLKLFRHIAEGEVGRTDLLRATSLPPTTQFRACEDMEAIGALVSWEQGVERRYRLTDEFSELYRMASPILSL